MSGSRVGLVVAAIAVLALTGAPASAAPRAEAVVLNAGGATAVDGSYIVVLRDGAVAASAVQARAGDLAARYGGTVGLTYRHALRGFEARLPQAAARRLAADPAVAYVEQNQTVRISESPEEPAVERPESLETQTPAPSWGLDRVDQHSLALDNSYTYPNTAATVRAYIIDTGIRFTHQDFGGRAVFGWDALDGDGSDCYGHGTHVAGTVGGSSYGIAKGVTLVGVRVYNCAGEATSAQIIGGVDWVTGDHDPGELAVVNMSVASWYDQAMNDAVTRSIADGITYAIAAGNGGGVNACGASPSSTPDAITVGATKSSDARSVYSNIGSCLDLFAPGSGITSAWNTGDTATRTISGTSMAAPHVTGAAALVLAANPTLTPQQVRDALVRDATPDVVTDPGPGSPNRLLFVNNGRPDFSLAVGPAAGTTSPGGSVSATVTTATTQPPAQSVALSTSGLPAGATASFSPATISSGASSTLTISTSASTAPGTYRIAITGAGSSSGQRVLYELTVNGPPGCSGTSDTDVPILDAGATESTIPINGCASAPASSTVEVHIARPFISELAVYLVAPDGSYFLLYNDGGTDGDNIDQTFTVNLSDKPANGTWRLRVDVASFGGAGVIDSWTLNLDGVTPPVGCSASNRNDVPIPDLSAAESPVTLAGCSGNALSTSTVEVHIVHTYVGDLVVSLTAPDGSTYPLRDRAGGGADNIDQTFSVDLSSEPRNGTWRLRVEDTASADTGYIDSWTLTL